MNITCADGDSYGVLIAALNDFLVVVELNDGRRISGYVTEPDDTTLGLRPRYLHYHRGSPAPRIEYDDIKTLVVQ